jgi:hypothetical protein
MSSKISNWDRDNIFKIMEGHGDWFGAQLLRLCQKADLGTLEQIRLGFPDHVALFEAWQKADYFEYLRARKRFGFAEMAAPDSGAEQL